MNDKRVFCKDCLHCTITYFDDGGFLGVNCAIMVDPVFGDKTPRGEYPYGCDAKNVNLNCPDYEEKE